MLFFLTLLAKEASSKYLIFLHWQILFSNKYYLTYKNIFIQIDILKRTKILNYTDQKRKMVLLILNTLCLFFTVYFYQQQFDIIKSNKKYTKYNKFMWNIITSNRLLDKKRKQEAQRKHLAALRNIKSSIDNNQPQSFSFLYTRPKARLLKLQRQNDIENSNNILVEKMISISTINRPQQTFVKDSLNLSYNKKMERQIDLGNEALVKRLRSVSSQYGQKNFGKFVEGYQRTKSNLHRSRANTTLYDLQMPSKNMSVTKRPYSSKFRPYSAKV